MKQLSHSPLFLIVLFALAILLRFWFISDNNIVFYWDQARDAMVSREILEQGDLKILGPSASGTADQVYHGVLFYYVIGPLYTLFGGNPAMVTMVLAVINSLGVFVLYRLGTDVLRSKRAGMIAAFLFAVSSNAVFFGTWLSNPTFAPLTIALFYLFLYRAAFLDESRAWVWAAIFLGLSHQSVVFTLYLWAAVIAALWWMYATKTLSKVKVSTLILALGVYVLTVSTMLIGELMLFQRGILNSSAVSRIAAGSVPFDEFLGIVSAYFKVFAQSGLPQYPLLSSLITVMALGVLYASVTSKERVWVTIYLLAPLALLLVLKRRDEHNLVGVSMLAYAVIGYMCARISRDRVYAAVLSVVLVGYVGLNVLSLVQQKDWKAHPLVVQKGAVLVDQMKAIDYMYTTAAGQEFSISSLTNPIGMNTTWAYLFDWYGKEKYGYVPAFVGPSQAGLFGEGVLEESMVAQEVHFMIKEPTDGIPKNLEDDVLTDQTARVGKVVEERRFGEMGVERRDNN